MGTILFFAVLSGLDNLHVSSVLGLTEIKKTKKYLLVLQFGLWEAFMPWVGLFGGHQIHTYLGESSRLVGPLVLFLCGFLILYQVLKDDESFDSLKSNLTLFALPFSLSLDNLFAGIGLGALGYPVVVTSLCVGLISAAMCFVGMFLGNKVRKWFPWDVDAFSGAYLMLLAVFMYATGK